MLKIKMLQYYLVGKYYWYQMVFSIAIDDKTTAKQYLQKNIEQRIRTKLLVSDNL